MPRNHSPAFALFLALGLALQAHAKGSVTLPGWELTQNNAPLGRMRMDVSKDALRFKTTLFSFIINCAGNNEQNWKVLLVNDDAKTFYEMSFETMHAKKNPEVYGRMILPHQKHHDSKEWDEGQYKLMGDGPVVAGHQTIEFEKIQKHLIAPKIQFVEDLMLCKDITLAPAVSQRMKLLRKYMKKQNDMYSVVDHNMLGVPLQMKWHRINEKGVVDNADYDLNTTKIVKTSFEPDHFGVPNSYKKVASEAEVLMVGFDGFDR